jgi:hypothetical protein
VLHRVSRKKETKIKEESILGVLGCWDLGARIGDETSSEMNGPIKAQAHWRFPSFCDP